MRRVWNSIREFLSRGHYLEFDMGTSETKAVFEIRSGNL
jgi:hypothetical protein